MEPALYAYLRERFGPQEAACIRDRWTATFGARVSAEAAPAVPARHEEYEDLVELLSEYAVDAQECTAAVARWLAFSCVGENHLWEDLGLPDRPELTRLIGERFPRLRELNRANMRWKKFLYRQLCDRAQVRACRAPHCGVCNEVHVCFGEERSGAPA